MAVCHVHAINPSGFAWLRRSNKDSVDLNRNFVDPSRIPRKAVCATMHDLILPRQWDDPMPAAIRTKLAVYTVKAMAERIDLARQG